MRQRRRILGPRSCWHVAGPEEVRRARLLGLAVTPSNKPLQRMNACAVRSSLRSCRDAAGCARGSSRPWYACASVRCSPLNGRSLDALDGAVLESCYERVHTMTDYYDGPRKGIADFEGQPHLYESEWDEHEDDWALTFKLSPVAPGVLTLALESWGIWRRWETALHEGRATRETHPALPEDRPRSDELHVILGRELKIDEQRCVRARGYFKPLEEPGWSGRGWRPLQVRWERS